MPTPRPPFDRSCLADYTLATRNLVMYPHLNFAGRLFGGLLMAWLDEGAAIIATQIMSRRSIATKKFSEVVFNAPGLVGDYVEIWCRKSKEGHTSLTLDCLAVVYRESPEPILIGSCSVVYVAIDADGRPEAWR